MVFEVRISPVGWSNLAFFNLCLRGCSAFVLLLALDFWFLGCVDDAELSVFGCPSRFASADGHNWEALQHRTPSDRAARLRGVFGRESSSCSRLEGILGGLRGPFEGTPRDHSFSNNLGTEELIELHTGSANVFTALASSDRRSGHVA